jgi:hypothetical protein
MLEKLLENYKHGVMKWAEDRLGLKHGVPRTCQVAETKER